VALLSGRSSGTSKPPADLTIRVTRQTFAALSQSPGFARKLMASFGGALRRSRATGRHERVVVDVSPSGEPKIAVATSGEADAAPQDDAARLDTALRSARERGRIRVAEILGAADMLSADAFAALLGTSRMTVNTWRQHRKVLALEGATRGFRFPAWQVGDDGKPFAGLPELFDRLGDSPWAVYRFLIQHHAELDDLTAKDALRRGRTADVLAVAENAGRAFG